MTETDNEAGESTSTGLPSDVLNIESEYSGDSQILCVVMMVNFFRERLTDERHSTLFPARTIVRDSHSRK